MSAQKTEATPIATTSPAPAPVSSPPNKAKPALVSRKSRTETSENRAVLKENYDYFPPVTEYYKPVLLGAEPVVPEDISWRDTVIPASTAIASLDKADDYDRLTSETDRVRHMFYDQWYHPGKRTLLDVLTAENDHFNNQLLAINNRYDGYISNINVISSAAMLLNWVGINRNSSEE